MIKDTFLFQFGKIKANRFVFLLVVIAACLSVYIGYLHDALMQSVVYLMVIWISSFFIDLYALKQPAMEDFPVRQPKKESKYYLLCFVLGWIYLLVRFAPSVDWQHLPGLIKLGTLPLIIFMYPVALVCIFLYLKYKPVDLGIRFRGMILYVPIVVLFIIASQMVCPERLTWDALMEECGGVFGLIFTGIIVAGFSEEFTRMIGQTRLGAYFNNFGMGWFITTVFWAFMHAPKWYSDSLDLTESILGSIRIIPIGLMWGYLTHRTKSLLPSVLVHGSNVWGLQNF